MLHIEHIVEHIVLENSVTCDSALYSSCNNRCVKSASSSSSSSSLNPLLLVEHGVSMKNLQTLRSSAIPLTSFHNLLGLLISSSIVLRHVLFGLPLLLYPLGFQSNSVFSIAHFSLRNMCPIHFHFFSLSDYLLTSVG